MVLNPLTDVGVGVFMAIRVSRGQLVMDILGHGEWCQAQHRTDNPPGYPIAEQPEEMPRSDPQRQHAARIRIRV